MKITQVFQTYLSQTAQYLKQIPKPFTAGNDINLCIGIEVHDSLTNDPGDSDIALTLSPIPVHTVSQESIRHIKELIGAGFYLRNPHEFVKRPANGKAEGFRFPVLSGGNLEFMVVQGDVEELGLRIPEIKPGWLLHRLATEESAVVGRYLHWRTLHDSQRLLDIPIPKIEFRSKPHSDAIDFFHHLFQLINPNWNQSAESRYQTLEYLVDWFLWGVGHPSAPNQPDPDRWTTDAHSKLHQVFSPIPMLVYPYDYFGHFLRSCKLKKYANPLSPERIDYLLKSLFPLKWGDYRQHVIGEPDVGTGDLMIRLAGYSYNVIGFQRIDDDFDPLMTKIAIANAYLYAPWIVFPFEFLNQEPMTEAQANIAAGKTLEIMRAKRTPKDYFAATQVDVLATDLLPIQIRRDRPTPTLPDTPTQTMPLPPSFFPNVGAETPRFLTDAAPTSPPSFLTEAAPTAPALEFLQAQPTAGLSGTPQAAHFLSGSSQPLDFLSTSDSLVEVELSDRAELPAPKQLPPSSPE